jgi:hypothetical protein
VGTAALCARYCGLVPITILIGAAVGEGGFCPLSIPLKLSQLPGHGPLAASICTELRAAERAAQITSTLVPLSDLKRMRTPVAAPAPDQFQDGASQCDCARTFLIETARPFGSGPSPRTYMAALVPANIDKAAIRLSLSDSDIDLGALNLSSAAWASSARAFALAIDALASSPSVESRVVSRVNSAILSREASRSLSQCSSLTSAVFTMTKVASTPPSKQASNIQLAIVATKVAVGNDISENGHIRIPDWFFIEGILLALIGGGLALGAKLRL